MNGAPGLTFTMDLEDHRSDERSPCRYPHNARVVLAFLNEQGIRATVFVVGNLVDEVPGLLREIAAAGHEIALHSYRHVTLEHESPESFRHELARSRTRLEQLTGLPIVGFRAPVFSLTSQSLWVVPVLSELGFQYSSSVLPARNPLHGFPGAPRRAFSWPGGLLEIPAPVIKLGPLWVPFLGGFYLRYLPLPLIQRWLNSALEGQAPWTYCHPYDVDPDEPFFRIRGASWWVSVLLWWNRRATLGKLQTLFADTNPGPASRPFAEQLANGDFAHAPLFSPDSGESFGEHWPESVGDRKR